MICLSSHMPLLRVGQHDVAHYEARWIEDIILRAAENAGHAQWWPAADVARGIIQFLRDRFQKNIITLQDLFSRIGHTLQNIGFPEIASAIEAEPPPMEVCLLDLAREAGTGFELLFFRGLGDELAELRRLGATRLHCIQAHEAVRYLTGARTWTPACQSLEAEVVEFVTKSMIRTAPAGPITLLVR